MGEKKDVFNDCAALKGMNIISGRWSLPIVHTLLTGAKRFKELERDLLGISTRMLVKELKTLEKNEIVRRKVYAEVPPKVEYSLTPKGKELHQLITEFGKWAEAYY